jgi:pyruvate dehydrogenase E1 component alpha subunit
MTAINHELILKGGRYRDLSLEGVSPDLVRALHRFMLRLRRVEQRLIEEYHPADEMRCPIHFCLGQEAVSAALSVLLMPADYLFSHHRSHGYLLAKGAPLEALFAELYGKETGANGGKAGSQDISMAVHRFYSGAILAGAVGIAIGAGFGLQAQQQPFVAVSGFGEAATEQGIFWEAVNYAVLKKLPVVLVCENNRYSTYSPQWKRQPADNISQRVAAFGMTTRTLFGNDVIQVHRTLREAAERARRGEGPTFVEAFTYRWNGHVGPEDDDHLGYRPAEERQFWKENCPVALLEEQMAARGLLTPDYKERLLGEITAEIDAAFRFARSSPFPANADWSALNDCPDSPLADRLLIDDTSAAFDENQRYAVPGPY